MDKSGKSCITTQEMHMRIRKQGRTLAAYTACVGSLIIRLSYLMRPGLGTAQTVTGVDASGLSHAMLQWQEMP